MSQLIIIGAGRSGTKFLRGLLAATDQFATVPYDVNYIWRGGNGSIKHDEIDPNSLTDVEKARIRRELYAQAGIRTDDDNCTLLEKSVPNSLRVPFVDTVFPSAKYLHIVRDGRHVVESAYRNWRQPPQFGYLLQKARTFPFRSWRYGLTYAQSLSKRLLMGDRYRSPVTWGPRYKGIDDDLKSLKMIEVVARQWVRCVSRSIDAFAKMPSDRWMEIRYEALVTNESTLSGIAEFVGIQNTRKLLSAYRSTLRRDNRDRWTRELKAEDRNLAMQEMSGLLRHLGYL